MNAFQIHLLASDDCHEDRMRELLRTGATGVALPVTRTRDSTQTRIDVIQKAGLPAWGWIEIGRDPEAVELHPEWMHAPQHAEWLDAFPDWTGGHPACVYPWLCVNNVEAFHYALRRVERLINAYPGMDGWFLNDIQGPPAGCGCGNILCRSWDNSPGPKIAPSPYENPDVFFTREFLHACRQSLPGSTSIPIICGECEVGVTMGGVESPDEVLRTCRGVNCARPCALDYFPGLARALEPEPCVGLLAPYKLLGRDVPLYGETAAWVQAAVTHYLELAPKTNLFAVVQGWDVTETERSAQLEKASAGGARGVLILETPLDQSWNPVSPPPGNEPAIAPLADSVRWSCQLDS